MKVIHIVESLDKGAVENWLVRMLEYGKINNKQVSWTFFCIESFKGRLEDRVEELGVEIIHAKNNWSKPVQLIKELRTLLKSTDYDVLHSHHDFMSALYLIAASNLPIKKIIHVHNMDEHIPTGSKLKKSILRPVFRRICWFKADQIVGISKHTLNQFLLNKKINHKKHRLHYYGVNPLPFFEAKYEREELRKSHNLNAASKILLFAGRLAPAKNPLFAVEVLREMVLIDSNVVGLFVGSGDLEHDILNKLNQYGLKDNYRFLGWSDNIPYLMKNSDLFILPHVEYPMEGLGLVVLEAQLSELPVLISKGVSMDPILENSLYRQLSLGIGADEWAKEGLDLMNIKNNHDFKIKNNFENSDFNMETAFSKLEELYEK
jgi:glycosyltransferase EpsF|nr:glycosyltransferase [uncultured Psychroserpens sp.]